MQLQWNWWGGLLKFDLVTSHVRSDDQVTRNRISWLGATLLSLYHLHITNTSSNLGFYHWRNDIALLIATHWSSIFGHAVKKKKTWQVPVFVTTFNNSFLFCRVLSLALSLAILPHCLSLVSPQSANRDGGASGVSTPLQFNWAGCLLKYWQGVGKMKKKSCALTTLHLFSKPSKPLEEVQEVLSRRGERGSCRLNYQTIDCWSACLAVPLPWQ